MEKSFPRVDHLADHVNAIPEIVSWLYAKWGEQMPDMTYSELVTIFEERITQHKIPETFVALVEKGIIGTASIVHNDMASRLKLSPNGCSLCKLRIPG